MTDLLNLCRALGHPCHLLKRLDAQLEVLLGLPSRVNDELDAVQTHYLFRADASQVGDETQPLLLGLNSTNGTGDRAVQH